jgi:hypothetical protein
MESREAPRQTYGENLDDTTSDHERSDQREAATWYQLGVSPSSAVPSNAAKHAGASKRGAHHQSTDPARDTAVALRRWLDLFDRHFVGLSGSDAELAAVQKTAGVPAAYRSDPRSASYSVAHANFVVAYTRDDRAHVIYPGGISADDWVHDLPLLIKEAW